MTLVEPTPPLPQGDPKVLLDAYRAANNGALPPGMTPEQAMLVDMGMWTEAVTQNPQLLTLLQGVATQRLQQQQDFAAGRAQVGQNYQQLTGDVAQQGTNWMADLMQRMGISPEAAAYDPNITGYGETIANMTETADQNQATDQAWFDKMAPVYDQNLATVMGQLATPPPVADMGGGGGGGGGGFRGGGRRGYGGGGSGGGDWSAPKTTDTTALAQDLNSAYYNPGFQDAVLQLFTEPSDIEYAQQLLDRYGGAPRDVGGGIVKSELPAITAALDAQLAQVAQRRAYYEALPVQAATALERGQTIEDQVRSQNNLGADDRNVRDYMDPTQRQDYNAETATYFFNRLAEHFGNKGAPPTDNPNAKWWPDLAQRDQEKNAKQSSQFEAAARYLQQERDKQRLLEAKQSATGQNPFSYEGWSGYVDPVSNRDVAENEWAKTIQEAVLGMAREFNPNYDWQVTKATQQDSADYKTTQSTKNPEMAIFDNDQLPTGETPMYDVFTPFGESRGLSIPKGTLDAVRAEAAQRLGQKAKGKAKEKTSVGRTERPNPPIVASQRPTVRPTGVKRVDDGKNDKKQNLLDNLATIKQTAHRLEMVKNLAAKRKGLIGKKGKKKKKI